VAADIFVGLPGLTKEAPGRLTKIQPAQGSYKRKARLPPKSSSERDALILYV